MLLVKFFSLRLCENCINSRRILCMYISQWKWTKTTTRTSKRNNKQHQQYTTRTTQATTTRTTTTITTRAVTVRVRPHLLDPSAPLAAPPRGARQWPYTNPRGARAYQKNPNCNAEWRSRILPPSQLGKSHGKTDSTINRLNSNEKSVNGLGVFRRGSGGENPRKCKKKPATSTCRPFAGLTGPTWSKHG